MNDADGGRKLQELDEKILEGECQIICENTDPRFKRRENYAPTPSKFLRDPDFLKKYGNEWVLYLFYRDGVWRGNHDSDIYNVYYNHYHLRSELAVCWKMEVLAEMFGQCEKTMRNWTDALAAKHWIRKHPQPGKPNVLVLGEHDHRGGQMWYLDHPYP